MLSYCICITRNSFIHSLTLLIIFFTGYAVFEHARLLCMCCLHVVTKLINSIVDLINLALKYKRCQAGRQAGRQCVCVFLILPREFTARQKGIHIFSWLIQLIVLRSLRFCESIVPSMQLIELQKKQRRRSRKERKSERERERARCLMMC